MFIMRLYIKTKKSEVELEVTKKKRENQFLRKLGKAGLIASVICLVNLERD